MQHKKDACVNYLHKGKTNETQKIERNTIQALHMYVHVGEQKKTPYIHNHSHEGHIQLLT